MSASIKTPEMNFAELKYQKKRPWFNLMRGLWPGMSKDITCVEKWKQ